MVNLGREKGYAVNQLVYVPSVVLGILGVLTLLAGKARCSFRATYWGWLMLSVAAMFSFLAAMTKCTILRSANVQDGLMGGAGFALFAFIIAKGWVFGVQLNRDVSSHACD